MMRRRTWLAAAAGLTVTFTAGCALPVIPKRPKPETEDALSWVRHVDGRYTLNLPRAELGQNILTALKQVACDELGIDWAQLDARLPATSDIAPVRATVGSESVKDFALPLAQACATLREALAAGRRDGVIAAQALPPEALRSLGGEGRYVGRSVPLDRTLTPPKT
jgi:isoquinoline 1-oxidoreductase beta subunit